MIPDLTESIRDVTADEVGFYEEHGWVMLRQLFSRELVAELLEAARSMLEPLPAEPRGNRSREPLSPDGIEPFRSISFSHRMGQVARTLINRGRLSDVDIPIQYHSDSLWGKDPGAWGTEYHQDDSVRPADRPGVFNMWLALDEVTPDMGALRFLTGVHREGPLGHPPTPEADPTLDEEAKRIHRERGILHYYPKLTDHYEWSPPLHYQPGDATVHHGSMIHGCPKNTTDRRRWAYILEYMPADSEFFFDGETRLRAGMNQHGLPTDRFPIVWP